MLIYYFQLDNTIYSFGGCSFVLILQFSVNVVESQGNV